MSGIVSGRRIRHCVWGCAVFLVCACSAPGQALLEYHGDPIPAGIETMYMKGLNYLVTAQATSGAWSDSSYGNNAGVVGLAVLAMLAHGDDPNYGPYSEPIKNGLEFILNAASTSTGYIGTSMYNHGFATLALAEAYGNVTDPRIGPALKKAVDLILTSQSRNEFQAWRYSPESRDADTTVSGAQLVALLAARNAGVAVPEKAIRSALRFYQQCQGGDGGFGYTDAGGSNAARAAIGALVFALAREKNTTEFKSAFRYLKQAGPQEEEGRPYYYMYYAAQALFHADMNAWRQWNGALVDRLRMMQNADGSWSGNHGSVFSTSTALLALALNYRFLPIYER